MEGKRMAVIVPYRDRKKHLEVFMPHMLEYLKGIDFRIFVVEQDNDHFFNKGTLLNVGFLETEKDFDYFCFHDIDFIPIDGDYTMEPGVVHLAGKPEQSGWKLSSPAYVGGVIMFDKASYRKINGFSNNYWGWGKEDDEIYFRCKLLNVPLIRRDGMYKCLAHERYINPNLFNDNIDYSNDLEKRLVNGTFSDGVSETKYRKNSETMLNDHAVHIKVDFDYTKAHGITKEEFIAGRARNRIGNFIKKLLGKKKNSKLF